MDEPTNHFGTIMTKGGAILHANEDYYMLTGYSKEEFDQLFGSNILLFIHPDDRKTVSIDIHNQLKQHPYTETLYRISKKNGTTVQHLLYGTKKKLPDDTSVFECTVFELTPDVCQLCCPSQYNCVYEKERYQILLECSNDIIYEYDIEADSITFYDKKHIEGDVFPLVTKLSHYLQSLSISGTVHADHVNKIPPILLGEMKGTVEILLRAPRNPLGRYFWYEMRGGVIRDRQGQSKVSVGILRNIDQQKQENLLLKMKSERDPLTNLYNKTATAAGISDYLTREGKHSAGALLLIDLDDFKSVNDYYGHQFGDVLICEVGKKLPQVFRDSDIIGRVGGDEFMVFMKDVAVPSAIIERAECLCRIFDGQKIGKHGASVYSSIGIARYPQDADTYDELFRKADAAMYQAKRRGKNCYQMADGIPQGKAHVPGTFAPHHCRTDEKNIMPLPVLQETIGALSKSADKSVAVNSALVAAGSFCAATRVCVYLRVPEEENLFTAAYQWSLHDTVPDQTRYRLSGGLSGLEQYFDPINNLLYCPDTGSDGCAMPALADMIHAHGVKSVLVTAIPDLNDVYGLVSIEDCTKAHFWTKEDCELIKLLANLLYMRICMIP